MQTKMPNNLVKFFAIDAIGLSELSGVYVYHLSQAILRYQDVALLALMEQLVLRK